MVNRLADLYAGAPVPSPWIIVKWHPGYRYIAQNNLFQPVFQSYFSFTYEIEPAK